MAEVTAVATLDTRGKICPEPNIMIKDKLPEIKPGEILEVVAIHLTSATWSAL